MASANQTPQYMFGNRPICSMAGACGYSRLKTVFEFSCSKASGDSGSCLLYTHKKNHDQVGHTDIVFNLERGIRKLLVSMGEERATRLAEIRS